MAPIDSDTRAGSEQGVDVMSDWRPAQLGTTTTLKTRHDSCSNNDTMDQPATESEHPMQTRSSLAPIVMLFALAAVSCSTNPVTVPSARDAGQADRDAAALAGNGGSSGGGTGAVGQACADAGGRCVVGGFLNCLKRGDQECNPDRNPGGGFCCLEEPLICAQHDYNVPIHASDYDQTCQTDSDCVAVGEGNACASCSLACTTAAISQRALDQYHDDIDKVGQIADPNVEVFCGCPALFPACCNAGHCHADSVCAHTN